MNTIFCQVDADDVISRVWEQYIPEVGPAARMPVAREGTRYETISQPFDLSAPPSASSKAYLVQGAAVWVETGTLSQVKAYGVDTIDAQADAARARILARPTNPEEYKFALADAEAFAEADFAGAVPRGVSGWAHAKRRKGWTAQQAAQDILDTAAAWVSMMYFIRDHRLDCKELVRDATTTHEVELILESFNDALSAVMQSIP